MTERSNFARPGGRIYAALAFAALLALTIAIAAAGQASGKPTHARTLGGTKHSPKPLCPQKPSETTKPPPTSDQIKHGCQVVGSVTGFQQMASGHRHAFVVPKSGKVVAWAVNVANPNHYEEKAFGSLDFFGTKALGGAPTARLAILKEKPHSHYKLVRQSPTMNLQSAEGSKQYITLQKPLKIKKGFVVGITMQTWAPILGFNSKVAKHNTWRASRKSGQVPVEQPQPEPCAGDRRQAADQAGLDPRLRLQLHRAPSVLGLLRPRRLAGGARHKQLVAGAGVRLAVLVVGVARAGAARTA